MSSTLLQTAIPILAYCGSSITMTLVNKLVLSSFEYHMVFFMLAVQAFGSVALMVLAHHVGLSVKYRAMNKKDATTWFPVACSQALMLYTGGKALEYLNVPLFTVFKNLTIIAVAYGEKWVFKASVTPLMLTSFSLMVLSSIVGAWNDMTFNGHGYFWMSFNCLASATFVIHMRKVIKQVNFKDFDTVYFNNLLTLPLYMIMSLLMEDWTGFTSYYSNPVNSAELYSFVRGMFVSGVAAFAISYCSPWCLRTTSSTTYSMIGALNKLPIALFAMLWFPDPITAGGVLAVMLGFAAGLVYTHAKNIQKRDAPQGAQVLPPPISMDRLNQNNEETANLAHPSSK
ncbi:GDP-mannose transporter into the lumen of the Golgi [Linderina macrospora]|uniref:GDP-mannose transporter into the lumen of the Golgi n=1 Tax=Linderina macrospora TaxID=4868 RepID=A0ACC1JA67_9FUNG|nr:GDP-mannose transporter into the lumen of the Golgi [Linderina macrospora]